MKKSQKAMLAVLTATVTAGSMFALTACQKPLKDEPLKGDALAVFSDGASDAFFESDGWCNGDVFNVTWSAENVTYADGAAKLSISDASATATVPYLGGELRSYQHFSYGDFSVRMKPAKVVGTASTFFTYTGPTEETDGEPNPHDEIDIEFLGADTTHVQFNYFVNGQGGHEFMYDLGFDASLEYHDYGFRWTEDYITWFVDGKPVHKVTASESNPIPSTPGRLLMNHWCGTENAEGWMGKYEGSDGKTADYASVSTTAEPIDDIPEIPDVPVGDIDWSELDAQPLEFTSSNGKHTATTEGTVTTVVYDGIGNDYSNINATVTDIAAEKNWVHLTLRNNATDGSTPIVRINVLGDGDKNLNASATMNGKPVQTDLQWGGSYFNNIPAGEDIEAVIYYKGVAKTLQLMLDSTRTGSETYSGNITISEIKFAKYGEIEMPEEPPVEENSSVMIGENEVSFAGAGYTVSSSDDKSSMTVTYDGITGNSYNTVTASVSEFVGDNNTFTVTITNNPAATAKIRMDIKCPKEHANAGNENNDFCNISAIYDGETVADGNDYQYGGADWVQIAAGATVTVKITFTANVATDITFFIDSSTWNDETSHSGEIVFSDMNLTNEEQEQA